METLSGGGITQGILFNIALQEVFIVYRVTWSPTSQCVQVASQGEETMIMNMKNKKVGLMLTLV